MSLKIISDRPESESGSSCGTSGAHVIPTSSGSLHAEQGFAGNVLMVTLGCAKNLVDSEVMLGALRARGFRPIDVPEQADLIVVNTCAFLQSAVEEGIDRILEMARLKETGRCRRLVVAGCMVERYRKDLESSLPEVDRFISTDELLTVGDEGETAEETFREARRPYFLYDESMPRVRSTLGHTAYVKISEGCNRPCSFCIIPKIRGEFRSRPVTSVVREVETLVQDGVKELNLVAQDLTAYGSDLLKSPSKNLLIDLLSEIENVKQRTGIPFWTRLLYAYPIGVTEELLRTILKSSSVCNYLDLPLQHISHAVLKRMNRPLGERGTRGLIEQIATVAPEIALRTTFIVGFPGETDEDIRSLVEFVSAGYFTNVGVFTYSQEPESKAYELSDQIAENVKEERKRMVMEAQQAVVAKRAEKFLGQRIQVLIDDLHEDSDLLVTARAEWQAPETDGTVIINELPDNFLSVDGESYETDRIKGRFAEVEITEIAGYDLVGKLLSLK